MKILPILYKPEMVRATKEGRKTKTRRIIKPQPVLLKERLKTPLPVDEAANILNALHNEGRRKMYTNGPLKGYAAPKAKYSVGDILWVKETWAVGKGYDDLSPTEIPLSEPYIKRHFLADGDKPDWAGRTRVSIHMPKTACRLFLEVTDVRAERLQDISGEDAIAEGIREFTKDGVGFKYGLESWHWSRQTGKPFMCRTREYAFEELWNSINSSPDKNWEANQWVWVYTFKVIDKPEGWPL